MDITTAATAYAIILIIIILVIDVLICAIAIAIQKAVINRSLWTVAIALTIAELVLKPTRIGGITALFYTAYRWDKERKTKKEENTTPPEV